MMTAFKSECKRKQGTIRTDGHACDPHDSKQPKLSGKQNRAPRQQTLENKNTTSIAARATMINTKPYTATTQNFSFNEERGLKPHKYGA